MRNVEAADLGIEVAVSQTGPVLESALAVPLQCSEVLLGWILLLDKLGAEDFSDEDERVLSTLGAEGAVAYRRLAGRREDQERLRRSQSMFENLFESAPDALLATDCAGRITQVNAQAERMFGFSRTELAGQVVEILVPERFRLVHPGHREAYHAEPRLRPMGAGLELFGRRKDGTEFPLNERFQAHVRALFNHREGREPEPSVESWTCEYVLDPIVMVWLYPVPS
ncbi:MAG TPA: PAS domain S-box protein [Bryobacteraceae bacterium]|nr:PAS domain S-box protein [Bryobacteraceae bacterium]